MPYMELFALKLDQHAPCFSISEKAYATRPFEYSKPPLAKKWQNKYISKHIMN